MPAPNIEDLAAGTVLGDRYRLGGRLGAGGMAVAYEALDLATGAAVAIKVMSRASVGDPELLARFAREGDVMGRLNASPHIVSVHDVGAHIDGRRYIVMELVRGVDLQTELAERRRLRDRGSPEGRMSVERICRIALDVARGLRDAHAAGVVHRDVKPSNILLGHAHAGGEVAKLVDFGISADLGKRGIERTLTRAGISIGTPEYMSPEQALALEAATSFDIYSLGVTIYEMVQGKLPPHAIELSKGAPELDPIVQSPALDALVRACLEPNPNDRISSADVLVARLEQILRGLERQAVARQGPRRVSWPVAIGSVAMVTILGGLLLAWAFGALGR